LRDRVPGIYLRPIDFIPVDLPGKAKNPKFEGTGCRGLQLDVTSPHSFRSVDFGIHLLAALQELYPKRFTINESRMPRLVGRAWVREMIVNGKEPKAILQRIEKDAEAFRELRQKYLLYK
jgi:uncharacterized protein YbbC (DUF1343 family)